MNIASNSFQPQVAPQLFGQPQPSLLGGAPQLPDAMTQMMTIMMALFSTMLGGMMGGAQGSGMMPAQGGFGGGPSPMGSPGLGNFLGGGAPSSGAAPSGGGGFSPSGAAPVDVNSIQGGTDFGRKLAQDAAKNANGPGGWCFKWVSNSLRRHGVETSGASAYMAADQLARNDKFREVKIDPKEFNKLPPGAVVVWNKGPGKPHGHISIALGDGREASDKIRNQITNYGTSARVFLPK